MVIINTIKDYWVLITFLIGIISAFLMFIKSMVEATKCSLRNDILEIYDRCKETKKITHWQLQAIKYSYTVYKRLKGNSFIDEVVSRVKEFELID